MILCENIFMAPPRPNDWRWCFQSWNRLCKLFLGDSKSQKASKSHYWFKSYGNFAELVDFAYWWSFSGGGSAISGATPSSFDYKARIFLTQWPQYDAHILQGLLSVFLQFWQSDTYFRQSGNIRTTLTLDHNQENTWPVCLTIICHIAWEEFSRFSHKVAMSVCLWSVCAIGCSFF